MRDGAVLVVDVDAPAGAAEVGGDGALGDDGLGDEVAVRETDALWRSRGPARVEQGGDARLPSARGSLIRSQGCSFVSSR